MELALVYGLLGLIVGSFLNVVIIRHAVRPLTGRSSCVSCGHTLSWYDLIPVFSWTLLGGKCRHCGSSISTRYLAVEVLTGVLFFFIGALALPLVAKMAALSSAAILVAIAVYDLEHTIIPDAWAFLFAGFSFLYAASSVSLYNYESIDMAIFLFSGPLATLPLFLLWFVSGGAWMGFGDVKLALGIGYLLGPVYGLAAIFFAFVIGALISVPLLILSSDFFNRFTPYHFLHRLHHGKSGKGFTMKSEIPFGPFLIASTFLVWFSTFYSLPLT